MVVQAVVTAISKPVGSCFSLVVQLRPSQLHWYQIWLLRVAFVLHYLVLQRPPYCQICSSLRPRGWWTFSLWGRPVLIYLVVNEASVLVFSDVHSPDLQALVALSSTPHPPKRIDSCQKTQRPITFQRHYRSQLLSPVLALLSIARQIQVTKGLTLVSSILFGSDTVILVSRVFCWPQLPPFRQISSSVFIVTPV